MAYSLESPVKKIMKHSTMNGEKTSGKKIMDVDTIAPPQLVKKITHTTAAFFHCSD
jgi:hypothetical protein